MPLTAQQLLKARTILDLTQKQLGELLGVDMRTVRRWEAEDRGIPPLIDLRAALTILRLHDALKKVGR